MVAASLDSLARLMALGSNSRRALLGGLAIASLAGSFNDTAAKNKKKRCQKKKRCGNGCCQPSRCFAQSVNPDGGDVLSHGCCPAGSLCRSDVPGYPDQCCYADETCDPRLPLTSPTLYTVCCRRCGEQCLPLDYICVDGMPQELHTARLPRYRR